MQMSLASLGPDPSVSATWRSSFRAFDPETLTRCDKTSSLLPDIYCLTVTLSGLLSTPDDSNSAVEPDPSVKDLSFLCVNILPPPASALKGDCSDS